MKIIITGAAGFLGGNVCQRLTDFGIDYVAVDNLKFGSEDNLPLGCHFIESGFENLSEEMLSEFDVLIHLACSNIIYAMEFPIETVLNNAVNTIELFSKFKGKIIYTSTASVYGDADVIPTKETDEIKLSNGYDTSKFIAEQFLRERGNYTTLRLSNVYGKFQSIDSPYCGVLGKFVDLYLEGQPLHIYGDGSATRDYTYVEDVVDAIILAMNNEPLNTELNIATGIETSIMELTALIGNKNGLVNKGKRMIDKINRRCLDTSKAKELLGWEAKIPVSTGIRKTMLAKSN